MFCVGVSGDDIALDDIAPDDEVESTTDRWNEWALAKDEAIGK